MIIADGEANGLITAAVIDLSYESFPEARELIRAWEQDMSIFRIREYVLKYIDEYPDLRELATARVIAIKLEGK